MKKLLTLLAAVLLSGMTFAQLDAVVVEEYAVHAGFVGTADLTGQTTYRVYAELTDATDVASSVFAVTGCHPLSIRSVGGVFYNSSFGSTIGTGINPALIAVFPEVEFDSFGTIGSSQDETCLGDDVQSAWTDATDPLADPFGNPAGGGDLAGDDGAWFALNGSCNGIPSGPNNSVLLFQVTTAGELEFDINVQVFDEGDGTGGRIDYVSSGNVGCSFAGEVDGSAIGLIFPAPSPGCTNMAACNFDATATVDDGSCCLDNCITVDMEDEFGDGWNGTEYVITDTDTSTEVARGDLDSADSGDGTTIGQDLLCLADGCYELTFETVDFGNEINVTITGADAALVVDGDADDLAVTSYAFSINTVCAVLGCTDMAACNFDPAATLDDGSCIAAAANDLCADATDLGSASTTLVGEDNSNACQNEGLVVPGGGCNTQDTWCTGDTDEQSSLWYTFTTPAADATVSITTSGFDTQIALLDACGGNVLFANDDGNGLSGALTFDCGDLTPSTQYWIVVDGFNGATGLFDLDLAIDDAACALGCTDMAACNFNAGATVDDGSCCFDNCVELVVDGAGFPGEMAWTISDGGGVVVASGDGNFGSATLCLVAGCYTIDMTDSFGDGWNGGSISLDGSLYDVDSAPLGDGDSIGQDFHDVGATGSCPVIGCTDMTACNYDPAATLDDGSCIAGPCINDLPELAYAINPAGYSCDGFSNEDIGAATVASPQGIYAPGNPDLWYSFVAPTAGISIEIITSDFDALIELQDAGNAQVDVEDVNFVDGSEILNFGGLTPGDTYFVRVAPFFAATSPALFDICLRELYDSRCDYPTVNPYDLCNVFKADWVYCCDYDWTFTADSDGSVYEYSPDAAYSFLLLSDAGIPWGDTYEVNIAAQWCMVDGNGNAEQISVVSDEPCDLTINAQPTAALNPALNVVNFGPHVVANYVEAQPFVCGAIDWEWTFVNTDGSQLPIIHLRGNNNRFLQLVAVSGLLEGATYDVTIAPVFDSGVGVSGSTDQISIIGPAEFAGVDVDGDDVEAEATVRDEVIITPEAAIYPNPASEFINLNVTNIGENADKVLVDIIDINGKIIQSEQFATTGASLQTIVSLDNLASGIYTVKIIVDGAVTNERLSIQR